MADVICPTRGFVLVFPFSRARLLCVPCLVVAVDSNFVHIS